MFYKCKPLLRHFLKSILKDQLLLNLQDTNNFVLHIWHQTEQVIL